MKLKLGLVGLGKDWQSRYQPALRLMQDRFEVRSVYSSVSALADPVARDFHAQRADGFRQMIARQDIDAVMMLESDWYGLTPLLAACDFGKAVFCGTEIDFEPENAKQIKERVEQSGIAFMTEFPRRFAPATLRLKELIATRLGKPRLLFCHRRLSCENPQVARCERSLDKRAQRELVELIDWCRFIVDRKPNWIQGVKHDGQNISSPDYQILSLGFDDDNHQDPSCLAQISCGAYIPAMWHEAIAYRPPAAAQVCCEKGLAFIDLPSTLVWFDEAGRHQESLETELSMGQQSLNQFHRSVTSLVRKSGGLEDIYRALAILDHSHDSMQSGRRESIVFDF